MKEGRVAREIEGIVRNGRRRVSTTELGISVITALSALCRMAREPGLAKLPLRDILPGELSEASSRYLSDEVWATIRERYSAVEWSVLRAAMDAETEVLDEDMTPGGILALSSHLLSGPACSVIEVGSGRGSFFRVLRAGGSDASFRGLEIDPFRWSYSVASTDADGIPGPDFICCDAFSHAVENPGFRAERVFGNYPMGIRSSHRRAVLELGRRIGIRVPSGISSDWEFNILLCALMKEGGRSVGIMTHGSASNASDREIRRLFISRGLVQAVIDLPPRVFEDTVVRTSLIVFSSGCERVKLLDAREMCLKVRGTEPDWRRIAKALEGDGDEVISVSRGKLEDMDYVLSAERSRVLDWHGMGFIPLEDILCSLSRGTALREKDIDALSSSEPTRLRMLMPSDISGGAFCWESLPSLNEPEGNESGHMGKDGDIIVTKTVGPLKAALCRIPEGCRVLVNSNLYILKVDRAKADPEFISLWLESRRGQAMALSLSAGTAVKTLSRSALGRMGIPGMGIGEQKRRVGEYRVLEERVSALRREMEMIKEAQLGILEETSEKS